MNVRELQRKLSQWATQDKERKFFDLYKLVMESGVALTVLPMAMSGKTAGV